MSETRRAFLQSTLSAAAAPAALALGQAGQPRVPWYRRCYRWGQTNITERDPTRYDIDWWRGYWKQTQVQGVIINAGGIVAYYPSKYPLHHRAEFLGDRDLFGELAEAAHKDGLAVFARMDSNRAAADFYKAHPDWFAVDGNGNPYRSGDGYVTCVNSPYYEEYIPGILREIIERSRPEGFTDNSWSGLGRNSICYCGNCERKFRDKTGKPVPRKAGWDDPVYRDWIMWNYARRLENWDLNNRVTRAAGGPDCVWVGMNGSSATSQSTSFRDIRGILERAEIIMLDSQRRSDAGGFQQNGDAGKMIHGLLGWDKLIPESMAMYQSGNNNFRLASKPAAEARMWMLEGIAGGIQPWWHHVGAFNEDRRMYNTAAPVMAWHKVNEAYLVNRQPVASVGVVWSQRNTDFYGRDQADRMVDLPYRGVTQALIRARIPYLPIHAGYIERSGQPLTLLILPNVAAMSDEECSAVRRFVERGGSLIATGVSSLYNEWGDSRQEFALADLFRAHAAGSKLGTPESSERRWATSSYHTYLRLTPGLRAGVLGGFEETEILPYGGMLEPMRVDSGAQVPLTFIPPFPVMPPETAWMRTPKTDIPALVLSTHAAGGRVAYMPADIDRRFATDNLPDHGNLLANLVRWAGGGTFPLRVDGPGLIDCHLYRQPGRMILHLVNLTSAGSWRAPIDELIPVGPFKVSVRLTPEIRGKAVRFLVSSAAAAAAVKDGWCSFSVKSILDHEVAVIA
jgi:hypothetical protein